MSHVDDEIPNPPRAPIRTPGGARPTAGAAGASRPRAGANEPVARDPHRGARPTDATPVGGGVPPRPNDEFPDLPRAGAEELGPNGPTTFRPAPGAQSTFRAANPRGTGQPRNYQDVGRVAPGPGWLERIIFGNISSGQLAIFCRQSAAYLAAGVDIVKTVSSLQAQFKRTALGPVLDRIEVGIRRGDSLAEAFAREPHVFDTLFLSMIQVAEARGGIPETLRGLAQHYEARQRLLRQARSALIYPIAVLLVATGVITLISVVLLPMFAEMLKDISGRGAQLPLPSRVLMAFSAFMGAVGWWLLPVSVVGGLFLLFRWHKTKTGKTTLDNVALSLPVLGMLLRKIDTARFARTLSDLTSAGVNINESLLLTSGVMRTEPFRLAVKNSQPLVMDGYELSEALAVSKRFTPDVIAVVNSGEETGKLPETLVKLADDYEEQVEYAVKNLGQLIQPLIVIMMGGFVLFIILAVFLPYLSMITGLAK